MLDIFSGLILGGFLIFLFYRLKPTKKRDQVREFPPRCDVSQ